MLNWHIESLKYLSLSSKLVKWIIPNNLLYPSILIKLKYFILTKITNCVQKCFDETFYSLSVYKYNLFTYSIYSSVKS